MRRLPLALLAAGLFTASGASAEPVSVELNSSSRGATGGVATTGWFAVDLGTLALSSGSSATYLIDGLRHGSDYSVTFNLARSGGWDTLTAEVLDPLDGDDAKDAATQPAYVPAGYSTSNKLDGFSFAQGSGMARSAEFVGGSASVFADEVTHARDLLMFSGLGGSEAQVNFGLRDRLGDRGFLLRLSASGLNDVSAVPEPASMFLIGTGLAGLAVYRRRRTR